MTELAPARVAAAAELLYALLPAHVRSVDADNGWAMKALFGVLAGGSVEIDREIDTLLDSMFVETAPETALADIAALVASEPLRVLPPGSGFSPRAFIANTVRYRRGKGTARVLEALATDVAGMGAVAVEYFQRLSRLQHLIDVRTERPGTAFLVPGTTAARTATGFDRLPRLVDVRSIARAGGRHHVPNVGVHVLRPVVRVFATPSGGATVAVDDLAGVALARPWPDGGTVHPGYFQLSEQPGRALRLFNPDRRSQTELDRVVETDLPDRLRRLPLHLETEERRHATLEARPAALGDAPWFDAIGQPFAIFLRRVGATTFERVPPDEVLIANLDAAPATAGARPAATRSHSWFEGKASGAVPKTATHPIACGFDPVTGRVIVATPAGGAADVEEVRVAHGTGIGREIGAGVQDRNTADVPFDVRDTSRLTHFIRIVDAIKPESGSPSSNVRPVMTLAKALTEWAAATPGMRGLIVLVRCDREGAAGGATTIPVAVHPDSELHFVSAQWREKKPSPGVPDDPQRRGYLVRRDRRFTIDAPVRVTASAPPPANGRPGILVLDGLELTGGVSIGARAVSRLLVRHSTVRAPGGTAIGTTAPLDGAEIAIDRAIVGRVNLDFGGGVAIGSIVVTDSIVSADEAAGGAISATSLDGRFRNVTVLGTSTFKSLEATNVVFDATVTVTRRQAGCLRFSWIAAGSAVPRRFRCQPDLAVTAAAARKEPVPLTTAERDTVALGLTPLYLDTSLDEPTVAMLHPLTRDAIRLGGEGDSEMGAFSAAAEGLRLANLTSLFDDYVPFGLEAGVIDDTRSSAVALRRNRP
jgi:hypothetical protein